MKAALLLLAHGSTENSDSSEPTRLLADKIRDLAVFSSVHCAFWREEPSFRQIFPAIEESEIYAVPNFISEGYFTRQVVPRELELTGKISKREGKKIYYCDPVGVHPAMTDLLQEKALDLIDGKVKPEETALIIAGHGTRLNKNSKAAISSQVDRLKKRTPPFSEILDAYLEEPPFLADWKTLTQSKM